MIVSKRISFDAAHYLPNHPGKCRNLHGHTFSIELGVKGDVDPKSGIVIDFSELKKFLEVIKEEFDHTLINDTIENPTAENICSYILDRFDEWWYFKNKAIDLAFIRVRETEDSMAELS